MAAHERLPPIVLWEIAHACLCAGLESTAIEILKKGTTEPLVHLSRESLSAIHEAQWIPYSI